MYVIYQKIDHPIKLSNMTIIPRNQDGESYLEIHSDQPLDIEVVDISDVFYHNYILYLKRTLNFDNDAIRLTLLRCHRDEAVLEIQTADPVYSVSIEEVSPNERLGSDHE